MDAFEFLKLFAQKMQVVGGAHEEIQNDELHDDGKDAEDSE